MAGEWDVVPLDQIYEFTSGLSKPRSEFGSGYPFLSFKDVFYNTFIPKEFTELVNSTEQERLSCSIKRGDVFLTRTSETLEDLGMSCVALSDVPGATFNGFTKRLRPKPDSVIIPEYAGYFFRSPTFRRAVTAMSSLSTRASLNHEMLVRLTITVPPPREQAAIGSILKSLDEGIELNRRMNETLEAMSRVFFKSWFVDFDPVRAKAEGRDPGLPKPLADLFPARLVDSELGEIPEGWRARLLGEVLKESNERVAKADAPEYSSTNEGLQPRSDRFTKKLAQSSINNKLIRNGYMVFGLSRRVLNFGVMRDEIGSVSAAYRVFAIDREEVEPDLLEKMMRIRSNYFYNAVSASSREGQSVSSGALGLLRFVQPSTSAQLAYYRMTANLRARQENLQTESHTLSSLSDTLLPKLISGELRVKDAEKFIERAV
jgi:type I restriction enzyme S subunit